MVVAMGGAVAHAQQPAQNTAAAVPDVLRGEALFKEKPRILHAYDGEAAGDQFGWVARVVGDVDGDGALDFVTSSPTSNAGAPGSGRIYCYSGKSGELLWKQDGKRGDLYGMSVAAAGDVNGDGEPDVAIGAPGSGRMPGRVAVLSGRNGELLLEVVGTQPGGMYGRKACGVGDLDGDGRGDLAIGAIQARTEAGNAAGMFEVVSGADGTTLFRVDGEQAGGNFSSGLESTMDLEHPFLIVGAMNEGAQNQGRVYVYLLYEDTADLLWTWDPPATGRNFGQYFTSIIGDVDADGTPDLYAADFSDVGKGRATGRIVVHSGATGEQILNIEGHVAGEGFGTSPSPAGDVNHDGHADLIVGAWQNAEGAPSAGKCYLHSGKDGSLLTAYTCMQTQDTFGFDAVGIGDVDGDGGIDFLLTSAWSPVLGPRTGRVFVIAGPVFEKSSDGEPR